MKQETLSDELLRKFLLGKVDEKERERIERSFLIDAEVKQRVLVAEQDFIEDYLENSLTALDKEIFLSVYAQTAEQRRRLRITRSIKAAAAAEMASYRSINAKSERWSQWLQLRPALVVPVGFTVALAIVIALVWLNSRTRQRHLALEQELAQLNAPANLGEVLPQMVSLDLSPLTLRSIEPQVELKKSADVRFVELRLPSFQKEQFSAFEAEIRRLGDDDAFTIRNLQPESDGRYSTRIRLPLHILRPGQYQVRLSGIPKSGFREEYQFIVSG